MELMKKRDENPKITVQGVKDSLLRLKEEIARRSGQQQRVTDVLNQFETTLSTQLPLKRYNHVIKLMRIFTNPDATSEEIENSLVAIN